MFLMISLLFLIFALSVKPHVESLYRSSGLQLQQMSYRAASVSCQPCESAILDVRPIEPLDDFSFSAFGILSMRNSKEKLPGSSNQVSNVRDHNKLLFYGTIKTWSMIFFFINILLLKSFKLKFSPTFEYG